MALLDAAVGTFLEVGYERATLDQIATRAGVSTGTLFKHFPTKAALFGAIMARAWVQSGPAEHSPPDPRTPLAVLRRVGLDYAAVLGAPSTIPLFRVVIAEAVRFPELGQQLYERGKAPYLERLEQYVRSAAAQGTLRIAEQEVPRAVREFLGMINDQVFWPRLLLTDLVVTSEHTDGVVTSAVHTFLARYGT